MYFLHAINSDRQTRLLNVLGQIAMILGDKKCVPFVFSKLRAKTYLRFTFDSPSYLTFYYNLLKN